MLRLWTIVGVSLFIGCAVYSQPFWRTDALGVQQGLSEGNVYVIHQDKKGFIWIGTHGGLNRYDGYGFRVFQYRPFSPATLGDNATFFLKVDPTTGKFWIGGSSCLNEFDPETFKNIRHQYSGKQLEFADGLFVNSHQMLLACEHDVLLFDIRKKEFSEILVYDEEEKAVQITRIENLSADYAGNIMVMSRTGVFFYDSTTRTCLRKTKYSPDFSRFNDHEIFNVTQDKQGLYWLATNKRGLIRYNATTGLANNIVLPSSIKTESLRFDVVAEDSRGMVWAGSSEGLFRIDTSSLIAESFRLGAGGDHEPEVNVISEDDNGLLWVGTVGAGVHKVIPFNSGFHNFPLNQRNPDGKTGSYVMSLRQLGDDIWFVNIWDQIGRVNLVSGKTTLLTKPLLPENYGWYSEGTLLPGGPDRLVLLNGESRCDIAQDKDERITVQSQPSPGLSYVYQSKDNKLWYMVKSPVEKTFHRNDTIYGNQFFFDAKEDDAGDLWIGSSRGLIHFNRRADIFTHFRHDVDDTTSIASDFIYKLQIDAYQVIWMAAYHGGLCSYDITSHSFRHYSAEDGLADNTVYSIEKDNHGNMWFSSNAGITSCDVRTKAFRNYGVADGLLNHEFNRRSSFTNGDGWMFFGGIAGIDYFHPDSIAKNQKDPVLAFTNFRIMDADYRPEGSKAIPVIDLKPGEKQITIEFASLDYRDQQKIQYAYRVNSDNWLKVGGQHVLSFSDLPPGNHELFIRSTNNEGIWLDNEISCIISVQPFWWQTWLAKAAVALFGVALIVLGIRFYYQRKLGKQKAALDRRQAVERERTRIATDMHDDLGASLSRIKFLSETIGLKRRRHEPIEEEVNSIRQYTFDMMDKMGEIVWALNERNDSLSDLLAYTRSYAVEYLSDNHIQAHVSTPEEVPDIFVTGDFRRNVYLTVKEALHNIVKHAQADIVDISIQISGGLSIRIHDNGKGFNELSVRPFSNGLSNMRKRVASLGGHFGIENTTGSTIYFEIPLQ